MPHFVVRRIIKAFQTLSSHNKICHVGTKV